MLNKMQTAWYITRLLVKLTPKGVVFSFLFFLNKMPCMRHNDSACLWLGKHCCACNMGTEACPSHATKIAKQTKSSMQYLRTPDAVPVMLQI